MAKILNTDFQHILEYVSYLIINDPMTYATDGANNRIVARYMKDVGADFKASTVHSLTRAKSHFLEDNPEYDFRDNNRGKNTGTVPTIEVA